MNSFLNCFAFLCLFHSIVAQFSLQQSSAQQSSQYPRIKIGGPLGQLIPNGFQLGAGLGSVINQLIGGSSQPSSTEPQSSGQQTVGSGQQQQMSASANSPFASLRSPFGQQFALSPSSASLYPSSSSPSLYSSGKYIQSFNPSLNPSLNPSANLFSNYNSDSGLYGSASSAPLMGHSSQLGGQLGSTNSDLFSHSFNSQQNFD